MRASKDNPTFGESGNRIKTLSVALMEPEFPLNVGYVARAMANFGMRQLLIVSRKKMARREEDEAAKFASHASQIINNMHYVKSVSDLRKRFHIIVGTTAIRGRRKSNITRKTMNVEECAKIVSAIASGSQKICILFGRDTTG
ncbi:MAG: TrmH family RNA methyltransferase, partial [Nitrososphaerales archaeon]